MTEARSLRLAVAVAVLLPGIAAASVRQVTLTYEVEPGLAQCPDERWVKQAVAARLGVDPFIPSAEVRVAARIRKAAPGLAATVQVTNPQGESLGKRELTSVTGDCLELASAMELAIAIAVDPQHLVAPVPEVEPPPGGGPEPAPPPPAPVPAPVPVVAPPPEATGSGPELQAGVAGFAGLGLAPSVLPGLALAVRLQWSRFSLGLEGRADLAAQVGFDGGRIGSTVFLGALVPCARFGRFDACGVLSAGALRVSADLTSPPRQETSPLVLAGARAAFELSITSWLSIRPYAELEVVITRTTLSSGTTRVWATLPVAGTVGASFWAQIF